MESSDRILQEQSHIGNAIFTNTPQRKRLSYFIGCVFKNIKKCYSNQQMATYKAKLNNLQKASVPKGSECILAMWVFCLLARIRFGYDEFKTAAI